MELQQAARYIVSMLLALVFLPLLLVLRLPMPDCRLVRDLQRAAHRALMLVLNIANIDCELLDRPNCRENPLVRWLAPPVLVYWSSPVVTRSKVSGTVHFIVRTYDQPGLWMSDQQLQKMRQWMLEVAENSMEEVPTHRLFDDDPRECLRNRVVSLIFDGDEPVGFTAMVYLPYLDEVLVHLGLTMIKNSHRGRRIQSTMFTKCLFVAIMNLGHPNLVITNIGASPAGIGAVSDYFFDVYPDYRQKTEKRPWHVAVANYVLSNFRHEFGCSSLAVFSKDTFVVHGSNDAKGGGSSEFIKIDGKPVSAYKSAMCAKFCQERLDYAAGDEMFQVGRVDLLGTATKFLVSTRLGR